MGSIARRYIAPLCGALWMVGMAVSVIKLQKYAYTPSAPALGGVRTWPAGSRLWQTVNAKTLVVFAHPYCPCTRATLEQLQRILARCRKTPNTHLVFISAGGAAAIGETLWQDARRIPGVQVVASGSEAALFQARTSGQTFVFDEAGTLMFAGGITAGRGHAGDNPGARAVLSLLNAEKSSYRHTSVFGCALFTNPQNTR
jgi:hypothetical protein